MDQAEIIWIAYRGDVFFRLHIPQLDSSSSDGDRRLDFSSSDGDRRPVGENATDLPLPNVATLVRVATSHSLTVPEFDPAASIVPSGENATDQIPLVSVRVPINCAEISSRGKKAPRRFPSESTVCTKISCLTRLERLVPPSDGITPS